MNGGEVVGGDPLEEPVTGKMRVRRSSTVLWRFSPHRSAETGDPVKGSRLDDHTFEVRLDSFSIVMGQKVRECVGGTFAVEIRAGDEFSDSMGQFRDSLGD